MSNTVQIDIPARSKEQSEILIAQLSEINFDAFEEKENSLSAYINEEDFNEAELNNVLSQKNISYTKKIIEETNWNAKWESEFEPIVIEDFVAIRASFHKPIANVQHEIIITPKMSFGTGHHATTWLMLQQMQRIDFTGKSVLDFGTGTGILAIMAKKLGAKKVTAIDNDVLSINNANENIIANNGSDIALIQKDNLDDLKSFDIILANINLNVISGSLQQLKVISHPSAVLLLSGFLITDKQTLINNFMAEGFKYISSMEKDNWLSMLIIKP
ncbi:MAG TPA: 50S ribosomal protein L11 methyltransferase [Chitinophagaceae bacterium]|nr:50S ribosomal protein L11 methyltransferase [Chitinophagaceae bacterium]